MSRERFIYRNGEVVYHEKNGEVVFDRRDEGPQGRGPFVMPDIKPYQSMVTGEEITSRSRHREHLREHRLEEVGNERLRPRAPQLAPGLKQDVIAAYNQAKGRR